MPLGQQTDQQTRLQANPQVGLTSKEVSTCHLSLTAEHHLGLSFGSHSGAGLSTSHYAAHVLLFVITITAISTGSAMGYLHLASLTYILTLSPKNVFFADVDGCVLTGAV